MADFKTRDFWYDLPEELIAQTPLEKRDTSRLLAVEELEFYEDIPCGDLFPGNDLREQILIFRLPGYDHESE